MYLGLDLGTGLTKLVRLGDHSGASGPDLALTLTPTAVRYQRFASEIPLVPPGGALPSGASSCDGFPLMLDGAWSSAHVPAWQHRAPGEVAQDFLQLLLGEPGQPEVPGRRAGPKGQPPVLAVAVPAAKPAWAGGGARVGPGAGTELREILTTLGYAQQRQVAAPVAALLHLRSRHPVLATATRVMVCDIGAGSIGLTLCLASEHGVRVADAVRLAGSLAWCEDTLADAESGQRPPTLAECLVAAFADASGATVPSGVGAVSVRRWRALERLLADTGQRDRIDAVLSQASLVPDRYGSTVALRFGDLEVTAAQVIDACAPLAERAAAALSGLLARQGDPAWLRPGTEAGTLVVLTGGLSALPPLRAALLASAGLDPGAPGNALIEPDHDSRLAAPALGAVLVAAGHADPGDRYPYGLRLLVHRRVRDRVVSGHLELAAAHSIDLELTETVFLTEDGQDVLVTVPAAPASAEGGLPLPVQLVSTGTGAPVPAALGSSFRPEPGTYRVGVRGGPAGVALVLQHTDGGAPLYYPVVEPGGRPSGGGITP